MFHEARHDQKPKNKQKYGKRRPYLSSWSLENNTVCWIVSVAAPTAPTVKVTNALLFRKSSASLLPWVKSMHVKSRRSTRVPLLHLYTVQSAWSSCLLDISCLFGQVTHIVLHLYMGGVYTGRQERKFDDDEIPGDLILGMHLSLQMTPLQPPNFRRALTRC
jgi:hypothetical protein